MKRGGLGRPEKAFTLAELLVASFVISVALLGVYGLFQQTMDVEGRMTLGMYHQGRAREVVDYFADVLDRCINLKDIDTIQAGGSEAGAFLEFTAVAKGFADRRCVIRQRITWQRTDEQNGYTVRCREMVYAGTANLSFPGKSPATWDALPAREVFGPVDALTVEFKEIDSPSSNWKPKYKGPVGRVAIRIRAVSGDQTAGRIVLPAANAVRE